MRRYWGKSKLVWILGAVCAAADYQHFIAGNSADVERKTVPGFLLAGGGKSDDESFRWFLERTGGGDVVILRASGTAAYNPYFMGLGVPVDSVETIVFQAAEAARDPFVLDRIRKAEGIFLAGGDQWNYVRYWKGTPVAGAINSAIARGVPVGGTSAGLAVLGEFAFSAEHDTVTSAQALADPFDERVTLARDFLRIADLKCLITDSHFSKRDRMGRLLVFLGRMRQESGCETVRGVGVDEGAVVILDGDGKARVTGEGAAYFVVLDRLPGLRKGVAATIPPMRVRRVVSGGSFDFRKWEGGAEYELAVAAGVVKASSGRGVYSE